MVVDFIPRVARGVASPEMVLALAVASSWNFGLVEFGGFRCNSYTNLDMESWRTLDDKSRREGGSAPRPDNSAK